MSMAVEKSWDEFNDDFRLIPEAERIYPEWIMFRMLGLDQLAHARSRRTRLDQLWHQAQTRLRERAEVDKREPYLLQRIEVGGRKSGMYYAYPAATVRAFIEVLSEGY